MDTFPHPSQRVQSLQSLIPPNTNPTNGHNPHICTLNGHRCNQSKHIDPLKLVDDFRNDATRQPDEPDTIFRNPRLISKYPSVGTQSGCITVKETDEPGTDRTR